MTSRTRYPPELRERAVRLVVEQQRSRQAHGLAGRLWIPGGVRSLDAESHVTHLVASLSVLAARWPFFSFGTQVSPVPLWT